MPYLIAIMFTGGAVIAALAAWTGHRGLVCDRLKGYEVPAHVQRDPELRRKANELVAFWGTGAALLCLPPVVLMIRVVLADSGDPPLWMLIALAVYGFMTGMIAHYPFEKIKRL
jgi:hypothetical protein